ncbi:MAG: hypothetical protein LBQ51_01835 [Desulfovibrio sp.]|nr:hypothetical protein [Desulfovibrio sp.]
MPSHTGLRSCYFKWLTFLTGQQWFELIYTPDILDSKKYPTMRDLDDLPVLATAIIEDVDILLTGDKDFEGLGLEIPEILTPAQFIAKYHDDI